VSLGHPERPERVLAIEHAIDTDGDLNALPRFAPPRLDPELLTVVHGKTLVETIERLCRRAGESGKEIWIDPDTWVNAASIEAALFSAGGAVEATRRVLHGDCRTIFSICRPPGHHATRDRAMGFCLFNNVAIAAQVAIDSGVARVAIVDFDVHHGNGTQDIFYERADVLYMSCHGSPLYPGTGAAGERGKGGGEGFTVNAPLAAGSGEPEYLAVFDELFAPAIRDFGPEMILLSAGFDGHIDDPLAGMALSTAAYGTLAGRIRDWAEQLTGGRSVWVLEGGYSLAALTGGVLEVLRQLL